MSRVIFITGTDTGVGKTTLTCLLLAHLRSEGISALAMKPFCTGGREDMESYRRIQGDELPSKLVNPFYYPQPLAPLMAARRTRKKVTCKMAVEAVRTAQQRCECLLVEGAGGVLVPITEDACIADLIKCLNGDVVVVAKNKLGTLNHTLLTVEALRRRGIDRIKVVFSEEKSPDISAGQNPAWVAKHLVNIGVYSIPYLDARRGHASVLEMGSLFFKKTLARIADPDSFSPRCSDRCETQRNERLKNEK